MRLLKFKGEKGWALEKKCKISADRQTDQVHSTELNKNISTPKKIHQTGRKLQFTSHDAWLFIIMNFFSVIFSFIMLNFKYTTMRSKNGIFCCCCCSSSIFLVQTIYHHFNFNLIYSFISFIAHFFLLTSLKVHGFAVFDVFTSITLSYLMYFMLWRKILFICS